MVNGDPMMGESAPVVESTVKADKAVDFTMKVYVFNVPRTCSASIVSMRKLPASHLWRARCFAIFLVV